MKNEKKKLAVNVDKASKKYIFSPKKKERNIIRESAQKKELCQS